MTPDTPLRLLIVDDDPTYYETFRDATGWSCEFVEEWDAEKIRHLLSTDRFDLLICDLHFGPVDQHQDCSDRPARLLGAPLLRCSENNVILQA